MIVWRMFKLAYYVYAVTKAYEVLIDLILAVKNARRNLKK